MESSLLEELRSSEGTLFHYESAKRLFLDTKSLFFDWAYAALEQDYDELIQQRQEGVEDEDLLQLALTSFPDIAKRIQQICVLYAKLTKSHKDKVNPVPYEYYFYRFFYRVCSIHSVMNSDFFDLDPVKQDYVLRDCFRDTLSDCLSTVKVKPVKTDKDVPDVESDSPSADSQVDHKQEEKDESVAPDARDNTEAAEVPDEHEVAESATKAREESARQESARPPADAESPHVSVSARSAMSMRSSRSSTSKIGAFMKPLMPKRILIESLIEN